MSEQSIDAGDALVDARALSAAADTARDRAAAATDATSAADWSARADALAGFADEASRIDAQESEIQHQLRWWTDRVGELEKDGPEAVAELALFRGRIAGATAMLRHYGLERSALGERIADAGGAGA